MINAELKLTILSEKVKSNPQDPLAWCDLISAQLSEGLLSEAKKSLRQAVTTLDKGLLIPEKFYKPLINTFLGQGEVLPIEFLIRDLELNYEVEDDEFIKRLVRKGRKAIRKELRGGSFPSFMKEDEWWSEGPHLVSEEKLEDWLPARIQKVKDDVVELLVMVHGDHDWLEVEIIEWEKDHLGELLSISKMSKVEGRCIEVGFYEDETIQVKMHKKEKK